MHKLHIDIETYSSVDITTSGAYKYMQSIDFEILMIAYAFDDEPVKIIDLAQNETLPKKFIAALLDPNVEKHAHNANFERQAFKVFGFDIPVNQWHCSAIRASYCGLPLSLEKVSAALNLGESGKLSTGKDLIRYFSIPVKPTKSNEMRHRNLPHHDFEKWEQFKRYCMNDVVAEREIGRKLAKYKIPQFERDNYLLDQKINDKGILIDLEMAETAFNIDNRFSGDLSQDLIRITQIDNPNSPAQLKKWLSDAMGKKITSLAKDDIPAMIDEAGAGPVSEALKLRQKLSKSSTKKYTAMMNCACEDNRAHGLFQFYGANKTGRWAGRLVQLQNLPQNHLDDLDTARDLVKSGDYDLIISAYDDVSSLLSQLIRTAFIAPEGKTFAVADFSAIEARVIAWLAGEQWRLDVFSTHGKIYEASAAMMFNVPVESIEKGSELRNKGKVAELALGYQGGVGALKAMGGESMGLSDNEMGEIVRKWRQANPSIVSLWSDVENNAKRAIRTRKPVISKYKNLEFLYDGTVLTIKLPSGRKLFYRNPSFTTNRFGQESIKYKGTGDKGIWGYIDTYGGKLVENIIQAIARDCLAQSMLELDKAGFEIVMHVHDEVVCEVPLENKEEHLERMCEIMGSEIHWAKGLPLNADGYLTPYYKKD